MRWIIKLLIAILFMPAFIIALIILIARVLWFIWGEFAWDLQKTGLEKVLFKIQKLMDWSQNK